MSFTNGIKRKIATFHNFTEWFVLKFISLKRAIRWQNDAHYRRLLETQSILSFGRSIQFGQCNYYGLNRKCKNLNDKCLFHAIDSDPKLHATWRFLYSCRLRIPLCIRWIVNRYLSSLWWRAIKLVILVVAKQYLTSILSHFPCQIKRHLMRFGGNRNTMLRVAILRSSTVEIELANFTHTKLSFPAFTNMEKETKKKKKSARSTGYK